MSKQQDDVEALPLSVIESLPHDDGCVLDRPDDEIEPFDNCVCWKTKVLSPPTQSLVPSHPRWPVLHQTRALRKGNKMNAIQNARDVLAKLREDATVGQWIVDLDRGETFDADNSPEVYSESNADSVVLQAGTVAGHDIPMIICTAGNPELWNAIDGMLAGANRYGALGAVELVGHADRVAAAIIAAHDRMSA